MKLRLLAALVVVGALAVASATAAPLTASDQAYANHVRLGSQYAQMDQATQARLHAVIHDPATAHHPAARRRAVALLLEQYRNGWLWSLGRP